MSSKMSVYGRLETLVICSGQLLALELHNNLKFRNKIIEKIIVLSNSIFLHEKTLH